MMEPSKKQILEYQMITFIKCVLDCAEREDKLDHVNIELSNHNGNVQLDYKLKARKKAY